jgi:hypothetical protein
MAHRLRTGCGYCHNRKNYFCRSRASLFRKTALTSLGGLMSAFGGKADQSAATKRSPVTGLAARGRLCRTAGHNVWSFHPSLHLAGNPGTL